jgi:cobalt-zinc-cadmium resistance protein CzcA
MGGVVSDMQRRVKQHVTSPPGILRHVGRRVLRTSSAAMARLSLIVPISVLLIFVLLFNAFGSVSIAAADLANAPFALVGGILACTPGST